MRYLLTQLNNHMNHWMHLCVRKYCFYKPTIHSEATSASFTLVIQNAPVDPSSSRFSSLHDIEHAFSNRDVSIICETKWEENCKKKEIQKSQVHGNTVNTSYLYCVLESFKILPKFLWKTVDKNQANSLVCMSIYVTVIFGVSLPHVPIFSPSPKRTDTLPAAVTRISSSDFGSSSWSYFWRTHQAQAYHHNQNERKKWEESNDISLKSKPLPIIVIHVHCGYGRPNLSKMKMAHNTNVCNVVYKQTMKHSHCRTSSFITTSSLSTYICKSQQKG